MKNKSFYTFLTYVFIFLSIFVLVIFTKDYFYNLSALNQEIANVEKNIESKESELANLKDIKTKIESWELGANFDFSKYLINFDEHKILNFLYSYAQRSANLNRVLINSINIDEWKINDFWFREWKINMSVTFVWEEDMIKMLNFLIENDSYNLFIHDFSYPYGKTNEPFNVNIPLKVLYK